MKLMGAHERKRAKKRRTGAGLLNSLEGTEV